MAADSPDTSERRGERTRLREILDVAIDIASPLEQLAQQIPVVLLDQLFRQSLELEEQAVPTFLELFKGRAAARAGMPDRDHHQAVDMRVLFEGILTDELVQVPLSRLIDAILDPLVQHHRTHPGFRALWLQSQGDPRLAPIHQDLTEVLTRKTAGIFARRCPKSDEASALRSSRICIRTVQALLPLASDGPDSDRQIIAELKTMLRVYLQTVFGSEGEG